MFNLILYQFKVYKQDKNTSAFSSRSLDIKSNNIKLNELVFSLTTKTSVLPHN